MLGLVWKNWSLLSNLQGLLASVFYLGGDMDYNSSLAKWFSLNEELRALQEGDFSETDTRVKIIDPILKVVLGWSEDCIRREPHTDRGYIDYILTSSHNQFIVEAKKTSVPFKMPKNKVLVNSELLQNTNKELYSAINQARDYAREKNVRFCMVANGVQIAITLTYPADKPEYDTILLNGVDVISANFQLLYSTCNPYEDGYEYLLKQLKVTGQLRAKPPFKRTINSLLTYRDIVTSNNFLVPYLRPILEEYFGEINDDVKKLDKLYCNTEEQNSFGQQISLYLRDRSKVFGFPVEEVEVTDHSAGAFSEKYKLSYQSGNGGHVFLLVGNVGAGKSTFLSNFYNRILDDFTRKKLIWVVINFLKFVEDEQTTLQNFINKELSKALKQEALDREININSWSTIKAIYSDYVEELTDGFYAMYKGSPRLEELLSEKLLEKKTKEPVDYWSRVVSYLRTVHKCDICVVMDNVDHHPSQMQIEITMNALKMSQDYKMLTIVTLRDESFWSLRLSLPMNAYKATAYHIVPPSASKMIQRRLHTARTDNPHRGKQYADIGNKSVEFNVNDFLSAIEESLKNDKNDVFGQFAGGNMRLALDLFDTYITTDHLDVNAFLRRFVQPEAILRHEVVKSIGLGNLKYFNSSKTKMLNLFYQQDDGFYSSFTLLRILEILSRNQQITENANIPKGFISIETLATMAYPFCVDEYQLRKSLIPLLQYFLVDSDIGARKMNEDNHHEKISYIKITPTGLFYLDNLVSMFTYLELVTYDTPITNQDDFENISKCARQLDTGRKTLEKRIALVDAFVEYLTKQEDSDFVYLDACNMSTKFSRLMPQIQKEYTQFKSTVSSKTKR